MNRECAWADPQSPDYQPDTVALVKNVAKVKASKARYEWNIDIEYEDLLQELYLYLFTESKAVRNGKVSAVILHARAADICYRRRLQESTSIIETDELYSILTQWNAMPRYVRDALYGPVFSRAGKGRYLQLIEYVHQYGGNYALMPSADKKAYRRAVVRLAEVIAGVMCGKPGSLSALPQDVADPDQELEALIAEQASESEDQTFSPWRGLYACEAGHQMHAALGSEPTGKTIGTKRGIYGVRHCSCGERLTLAAS
ncbi:hypothetical protein [Micromonospora sp. WMMD1274]|uniref:hypothetical protein n=1 Tax=Micromonospora sp. WMMD1274 TaxID=3404116 RepID=UPI003B9631BA